MWRCRFTGTSILALVLAIVLFSAACYAQQFDLSSVESKLTLQGSFTLRYHVIDHDVRTASMRASEVVGNKKSFAVNVQQGSMTQARADRALALIAVARPDYGCDVTISSDSTHFLYDLKPDDGTGDTIVLYDGTETYELKPSSDGYYTCIHNGLFGVNSLHEFPLPGAGVSGVPLLTLFPRFVSDKVIGTIPGSTPFFARGPAPTLQTFPSTITYSIQSGNLEVKNCAVNLPDGEHFQNWDFSEFEPLNGCMIAKTIKFTDYQDNTKNADGSWQGLAMGISTFQLLESSATALPASQFDYRSYLIKGNLMTDFTSGKPVLVSFDPEPLGD